MINNIKNDKNDMIFIEYSNNFNIKKTLFDNNDENKLKNIFLIKIEYKIITMNENKLIANFIKLIALL